MKPLPQIIEAQTRDGAIAAPRRSNAPKLDYAFRAGSIDEFRSRGNNRVRFRDLSGGYFEKEAPRAFATEAAVFAAILLTVSVPLVNSATAVMELVRSFGL